MSIKWSTPAGVPAPTNYDNPIGLQKLPQQRLTNTEIDLHVVKPKMATNVSNSVEPDSVYELSKEDVQALTRYSKKEPTVLVSKSYKEQERITRNAKFKKTTIKVRFPDGMELRRCFHPLQPFSDVYEFVRKSLRDQWVFGLTTNTGRRTLIPEDNTTLAKHGFVPGVVLVISFQNKVEKPYLIDALMSAAE